MNYLISSLDLLGEIKLVGSLFSVIDRYLNRNYKNYRIEHSYRVLTKHLLENIPLLDKHKAKIIGLVVREGLRLNLVTKSMCEKMDIPSMRLNFIEKEKLMYIKDPLHISEVTRVEPASLELICSNHNLEETAVEAEKYII